MYCAAAPDTLESNVAAPRADAAYDCAPGTGRTRGPTAMWSVLDGVCFCHYDLDRSTVPEWKTSPVLTKPIQSV
jgi:hypothetical protein